MMIIGIDYHPSFQTIAFFMEETVIRVRICTNRCRCHSSCRRSRLPDEEPDFRFSDQVPVLGIELSEVLRPASSNHGILPVEQESFHKEIIAKAQQDYYDGPDAKPVHVSV